MKPQGSNVKKLIIRRMSVVAVPSSGGLADALKFLSSKESITAGAREATEWVETAIRAVKEAPGNPYGDDEEAIAGEILRQIEEREKARA